MIFAYSYIRFSTAEQAKGGSLRRQIELREKYLAEKDRNGSWMEPLPANSGRALIMCVSFFQVFHELAEMGQKVRKQLMVFVLEHYLSE